MVTGELPFKGKTQEATFDLIKKGVYKAPQCSEEAKDLISNLLKLKSEERIGAYSIDDIKNHPFFESINFDDIFDK